MNRIVADVDNKPTLKEKFAIDAIKNSLISDLKQDKKISDDERKKLIDGINTIPFVLVDTDTIQLITGENSLGCYFGYLDNFKNLVTVILVDRERIKLGVHFDETIDTFFNIYCFYRYKLMFLNIHKYFFIFIY